jgi:serine/threonine protein kinase
LVSYLSPEQVLGHHVGEPGTGVDQRSDLYALGATLYCLIAGQPPFCRDADVALFDSIVQDRAPPLAGGDVAVGELIAALLEKSPAARPQRASEVKDTLAAWCQRAGVSPAERVAATVVSLGLPSLTA